MPMVILRDIMERHCKTVLLGTLSFSENSRFRFSSNFAVASTGHSMDIYIDLSNVGRPTIGT